MQQKEHNIEPQAFTAFFERLKAKTPIQNQTQLAEALQVGKAAISLAKQKDQVPTKWLFILADLYGLNSNWLATGKGKPEPEVCSGQHQEIELPHVLPRLDSQGKIIPDPNRETINFLLPVAFHDQAMPAQNLFCLDMPGTCMEPEIKNSDLLFIDRSCNKIYPGVIYALGMQRSVIIRRIEQFGPWLLLYAENPCCPKLKLDMQQQESLLVLGRVIGIYRSFALQTHLQKVNP